ncbi:TM2 domain-containing membrane protein YozV [Bartonella japonica]|uniref:TM2 domain-containing membrane protein YozV n=1 Tax=Bartonella japonica TaxID=357761 RepID=A0ABV2FPG6_9HYPH
MVGKIGTGILMLILTITLLGAIISGIWALIDFMFILTGHFTDKNGCKITS